MDNPLRVGIIGLGRHWQRRYKPALHALRGHFEVRALCDQVRQRADKEARRLSCRAASGPVALLESADIDSVLLLDAQWFRLWPLELACRFGKPVFCSCPLNLDDARADAVRQQVLQSGLTVMMAMTARLAAATVRLRELLANDLGRARLLLCHDIRPARDPRRFPPCGRPGKTLGLGTSLLDWCFFLLGGEAASILAVSLKGGEFASLFLEFGEGRAAQINRRCTRGHAAFSCWTWWLNVGRPGWNGPTKCVGPDRTGPTFML